ncbi:MAG: outer membrane lipoprotein carrier protein LolA [Gemmatimonadota bacterium]|nr:outer membrane lipoprotein carrier protein LolA [Gemmatimonadota bacterium]
MIRMTRVEVATVVLSLALLPSGGRAQSGAGGGEVLRRAETLYAGVRTLCADFVQELEVPLLRESHSGRGRLCQSRPDRFAMRFSEPAGDLVIADGTSVWRYLPSQDPRQAFRVPMEGGAGTVDLHRQFLQDPQTKYVIADEGTDTLGGRTVHRIRLTPRAPSSFVAAVVWIGSGDALLYRVRVEEENGTVRTITLQEIEANRSVPDGFFSFQPPAGVHVIQR